MLAYVLLLLFCLALASVTLWVTRLIGNSYQTMLRHKRREARHSFSACLPTMTTNEAIDWGWRRGGGISSYRRRRTGVNDMNFIRPVSLASISKPWGW